ncbi:response regulator transcription factor [Sulfurimonas sp.]|uniref:response regulator transcription factor n=1 Tax=Sulfurimonas sp. TaxID=2022749 RepID=UPI00260DBC4B|nr:response regulator transcription factor [Sulfurimonas sp.]
MSKTILLIEDDVDIQNLLVEYLKNYNFDVVVFANPLDALKTFSAKKETYSLVILDLMLPQMDGFDVCKQLRKNSDIPIIISSARGEVSDKILAFEAGADDYLSKPYEPRELIIRINAIMRRVQKNGIIQVADLSINENKKEVTIDGFRVDLTKIEFDILLFFVQNSEKIISRELLCNAIEGIEYETKGRSVDMHISNLRQKIGDDAKNPKYIKSVWGIGYKFIGK